MKKVTLRKPKNKTDGQATMQVTTPAPVPVPTAEQIELTALIENSQLRQWAHNNKGAAFVWGRRNATTDGKPQIGWTTFYLPDVQAYLDLIESVNALLVRASNGNYGVQVVQTTPVK